MRKLRLFTPALLSLSAGAMYLLAKEDLKRKAEGKANVIDAVKENGSTLVTNEAKKDALIKLLKLEVAGVADTVSKKVNELKTFISDNSKDFIDEVQEEFEEKKDTLEKIEKDILQSIDDLKNDEIKEVYLSEDEIQKVKDIVAEVIMDRPKRGRPKKDEV